QRPSRAHETARRLRCLHEVKAGRLVRDRYADRAVREDRDAEVRQAWRDLSKLPRELWILCFANFVNRLGTMALPFLALYVTRDLGFSTTHAGVALALYGG